MTWYAQIRRGKVRLVIQADSLPIGDGWIECPDQENPPTVGQAWDGTSFSDPVFDYWIESETFYDLFTADEQEDLEDSANKKIKWFLRQLTVRRYIPVVSRLETALNALETAGLIGSGRAAEIIAQTHKWKVTERRP